MAAVRYSRGLAYWVFRPARPASYVLSSMRIKIQEAAEVLRATPKALGSLLDGLGDEWTGSVGERENWQPFDVVGHLIHGEKTDWIPRARIILAQGEDRIFVPFDRLAQFHVPTEKALAELLDEFENLRTENVETLLSWNLSDEQLSLKGTHPELGEVSLSELIATWVVHDLNHLRQIVTVMAARYGDEVGPWRAYLSILNDKP